MPRFEEKNVFLKFFSLSLFSRYVEYYVEFGGVNPVIGRDNLVPSKLEARKKFNR